MRVTREEGRGGWSEAQVAGCGAHGGDILGQHLTSAVLEVGSGCSIELLTGLQKGAGAGVTGSTVSWPHLVLMAKDLVLFGQRLQLLTLLVVEAAQLLGNLHAATPEPLQASHGRHRLMLVGLGCGSVGCWVLARPTCCRGTMPDSC